MKTPPSLENQIIIYETDDGKAQISVIRKFRITATYSNPVSEEYSATINLC